MGDYPDAALEAGTVAPEFELSIALIIQGTVAPVVRNDRCRLTAQGGLDDQIVVSVTASSAGGDVRQREIAD